MKFVLYNDDQPGILTDAGVVDIGDLCPGSGQAAIVHLIANYGDLKSELETRAIEGTPVAVAQLRAPLRPGKILCMGGNFREFGAREPAPMWGFKKSLHTVLGPGGTVALPDVDANIFHHEAELVLVFGKGGRDIAASEAMEYVFGYTAGVDVSARMPGGSGGREPGILPVAEHKSHPTFCPLGPCMVTMDEIGQRQLFWPLLLPHWIMMLLYMSSGLFKCLSGLLEDRVDFASNITFEATNDLSLAHSFRGSSAQVRLCPQVVAQPDDDYTI